jgi:DNA polymerase V
MHGARVAEKVCKQGSLIKMMLAFSHSNPFSDGPIYRCNIHHGFFESTANNRDLSNATSKAAKQIYCQSVLFHKSGKETFEPLNRVMYQWDMFSVQGRAPLLWAL